MLHHIVASMTPARCLLHRSMPNAVIENCTISIVRSQFICALQELIVRRRVEGRVERSLELATSFWVAKSGAVRREAN
jgi:hypothetical protein